MLRKSTSIMLVAIILLWLSVPMAVGDGGVGVGVSPSSLEYNVTGESPVSKELFVVNTGDVKARYDLSFDSQYQGMFTFDRNGFELNPGDSQKVKITYNPTLNPERTDLNIHLYVEGAESGSNVGAGVKIPVQVHHQQTLSTTTSTVNRRHFPLASSDPEIARALQYLSSRQSADGGVDGFDTSCWAAMAIASCGYDPHSWKKESASIVDYLINSRSQVDLNKVTDIAKFILALTASNENPRNVGGVDYVSLLEDKFINGQFGDESMYNDDFWAIMALTSAGVSPSSPKIQQSASFIKNHQNSDGGWSWHNGPSDVDDTAAAIMALTSAMEGSQSPYITAAVNYLKSQLGPNGGFTYMGQANVASDAWAMMALVACGVDPTSLEWIHADVSPVDHLLSLQNSDGSFSWSPGQVGSAWWTSYAIPALLGKSYPVKGATTQQYTTTTNLQSSSSRTTSVVGKGKVKVRIEDVTRTIWSGWVEIPQSRTILCYNSGRQYTIQGDNVLAILDEASEVGGFSYTVSDQWYPSMGVYVDSIGGHKAEGEYGWVYRVNYALGSVSVDNFKVSDSDQILFYYGTENVRPLRVQVDKVEVDVGEPFTVTVEFRDDLTGSWAPLPGATIHVNHDYVTDSQGKATITLNEKRVYNIYAERWGSTPADQYVRSDVIQVGVGVPIPEFSRMFAAAVSAISATLILLVLRLRQAPQHW